MNPKDWKDAMHHEAGAVSDDNWAQETKQAARLFGWREQLPGFLLALGCALTVAVISLLLWEPVLKLFFQKHVFIHYAVQIGFLIFAGAGLGRLNLSPLSIGVGFGFLPLADGILTLLASLYALNSHSYSQTGILSNIALAQSTSGLQFWIIPMMLLTAALTYTGALLGQRSSRRARTA